MPTGDAEPNVGAHIALTNVLANAVADDQGGGFSATLGYDSLAITGYTQDDTAAVTVGVTVTLQGGQGGALSASDGLATQPYFLAVEGSRGVRRRRRTTGWPSRASTSKTRRS